MCRKTYDPRTAMIEKLGALLFPEEPRPLPGRRGLKILFRAVHVLFAGVLMGSYVFDVEAAQRAHWFSGTVVSGLLILLLDLHETGAFLLQVRGMVVLGKLLVLFPLPWFAGWEAEVLGLLVLISVLSSHAPSGFRYFVVIGRGKVKASCSKG
ncbi:MAG: hypothetical protein ACYTF5_09960 [Planctomycetota bacterium]